MTRENISNLIENIENSIENKVDNLKRNQSIDDLIDFVSIFNSYNLLIENDGRIIYLSSKLKRILNIDKYNLNELKLNELLNLDVEKLQYEINEAKNNNLNYIKAKIKNINGEYELYLIKINAIDLNDNTYFLIEFININDWLIIENEIKKANEQLTLANAELLDRIDHLSALNNRLIESERYLTELNSKKDRFLWIISHDLKNYLNSILKCSKKLRFEFNKLSDVDILENIDLINISSDSMFSMLENLIEWSNIQTGRIKVVISDYNLSEIIFNSLNTYNYEIIRKKINIINEISPEIYVKVDINIINIILRNIISNSIKYCNLEGYIKFYVFEDSLYKLTLCIEDNGIGIDERIMRNLFNYRIINKTFGTLGETGSGIGLILVKDLIEGIGSKIWLESKLGEGTKVYFTLYKGSKEFNEI